MPKASKASLRLSLAVQYATQDQHLPSRDQLRRWIYAALERDATITLRIVSAKEGRALNFDYRNKDHATNVLTFVYDGTADGQLSGDIVLCAPVIAREARQQRKELQHHYAHMVTHATLHLQGYDHEIDNDALLMEEREVAVLARMKIANPYDAGSELLVDPANKSE